MDESARQLQSLLDLDARHDDLLERLDALDKRVADVLSKYTLGRIPQDGVTGSTTGLNVAVADPSGGD
jgi:hypothetical protein